MQFLKYTNVPNGFHYKNTNNIPNKQHLSNNRILSIFTFITHRILFTKSQYKPQNCIRNLFQNCPDNQSTLARIPIIHIIYFR